MCKVRVYSVVFYCKTNGFDCLFESLFFFTPDRFVPTAYGAPAPRLDFTTDGPKGYCYTWWRYSGSGKMLAEVRLTSGSACTVTRTVLHEVRKYFFPFLSVTCICGSNQTSFFFVSNSDLPQSDLVPRAPAQRP